MCICVRVSPCSLAFASSAAAAPAVLAEASATALLRRISAAPSPEAHHHRHIKAAVPLYFVNLAGNCTTTCQWIGLQQFCNPHCFYVIVLSADPFGTKALLETLGGYLFFAHSATAPIGVAFGRFPPLLLKAVAETTAPTSYRQTIQIFVPAAPTVVLNSLEAIPKVYRDPIVGLYIDRG